MADETTSTTEGQKPQEPVVDVAPATTTPPSSESQRPPGEEQKVEGPPELSDEQIEQLLSRKDVQARMFRQVQSMKDKELHQERLKRQQEEERRRREGMDDEEYGSYTRAQEQRQATLQQGVTQALGGLFTQMQEQALSVISNKKVREEMAAKSASFETFPEFLQACAKAESEHQIGLRMTRREKELRASLTEEIRADQAEQLYPQLGRGLPTAREPDLHGQSAIAAGVKAELEKQRKKG